LSDEVEQLRRTLKEQREATRDLIARCRRLLKVIADSYTIAPAELTIKADDLVNEIDRMKLED
jgi:DNA-directed RNA polymerase specialized sigma subunit